MYLCTNTRVHVYKTNIYRGWTLIHKDETRWEGAWRVMVQYGRKPQSIRWRRSRHLHREAGSIRPCAPPYSTKPAASECELLEESHHRPQSDPWASSDEHQGGNRGCGRRRWQRTRTTWGLVGKDWLRGRDEPQWGALRPLYMSLPSTIDVALLYPCCLFMYPTQMHVCVRR